MGKTTTGQKSQVPTWALCGPCNFTKWQAGPLVLTVAHAPSVPIVWKLGGRAVASILSTVVAMGPLVAQTSY